MSPEIHPIRFTRKEFFLLAILCLGLFLRAYDLAGESMWLDETVSVRLAHKGVSAIVKNRASNIHPPLYFLLLRGWVALFGDSESATRSLSVLFGMAAIFMMFKVGSLFFDQEVGLLSSLLLAVSRFHIQYSQEARAYSLMALLTLLSIYFFKRFLDDGNRGVSIGYVLSNALLAYTHTFGLLLPLVENLYVAVLLFLTPERLKASIKKWIVLQCWVALLFAPWIPVLIKQVLRFQGGFRRPAPTLGTLLSTFENFSGGEKLAALFVCFALLSLVSWRRAEGDTSGKGTPGRKGSLREKISLAEVGRTDFLWLWLLLPVILPFLISQFSSPVYKYRIVISASLALYLLVAKGIKNLNY
ncbi:MAG: glycosyltransferase family 39 protein, partial [candidate division NC10 bacterium]|nr:glycosyltransferase family 39 protein [candidate division NC10 bacterium]